MAWLEHTRGVTGLRLERIDVWWAMLSDATSSMTRILDATERSRHGSYRHEPDRTRFLLGCAMVRHAAATRLGLEPEEIGLTRDCDACGRPHGRVRLPAGSGLEVSVSHSADRVLVALSASGRVGVDVEHVSGRDFDAVSELVLHPAEQNLVELTSDRATAFVRLWTRKEAVLKATGDGLRVDPKELRVAGPNEPPAVISWDGRDEIVPRLQLADLSVGPAYSAAVALIAETPSPVKTHRFCPPSADI